jgi:DNA-binding CsgD family transcriptional regulator
MVTAGALIGRDREMSRFADALAVVRAGAPRVVLLRGPRGIGKSAVIDAALAGRPAGFGTVLRTQCPVEAKAFGGACGLFEAAFAGGVLRHGLSALRSLDDISSEEGQVLAYSIQHRLHQEVLARIDRAGGLVLVLDDVQHCDAQTARWLGFTLRRAAGLPLLVVLGQRTEALTTGCAPPEGLLDQQYDGVVVVELGPLPGPHAAVLAAQAFGATVDDGVPGEYAGAAGGNPGALLHLVKELRGTGGPPVGGGVSQVLALGRRVAQRDQLAVLGRTEHALAVARGVAALGTTDAELVATLTSVPVGRVAEIVELLRRGHFLDESGAAARIAAPVLDTLPAGERERLRVRAAWLLSIAGRPAGQVAERLLPLPRRTEPWMLDILREAVRRAPFEARQRFLLPLYAADREDPRVRVELADTVVRDDPNRALELLREAAALTADVRERAEITVKAAVVAMAVNRTADVLELVDTVLEELEAVDGPSRAVRQDLVRNLVAIRLISGLSDLRTFRATLAGAKGLSHPGTGGDTASERLLAAAWALLVTARGDAAHTALEHASTAAGLVSSRRCVVGSFAAALVRHLAGDRAGALAALGQLVEESVPDEDPCATSAALALRSLIRAESEELSGAHADASQAMALAGRTGAPPSVARVAMASVLLLRNEVDAAASVLGESMTRNVWQYHEYLMTRARLRWAQGDAQAAIEDLTACGASLREVGIANPVLAPWWLDLARLLAELGREEEARDAVEHGVDLAGRWGTGHALGLARLAQGTIACRRQAPVLLTEAVDLLSAAADRVRQVQAERQLGLALARGGELRPGRARLRHAVDLAVRWGQRAAAEQARTDLEGLGGRMGRREAVWTGSLTPSERRVVAMAASGSNNRHIAEALVVSLRTVEIHLTSAYRKLGVSGRGQLVTAIAEHAGTATPGVIR